MNCSVDTFLLRMARGAAIVAAVSGPIVKIANPMCSQRSRDMPQRLVPDDLDRWLDTLFALLGTTHAQFRGRHRDDHEHDEENRGNHGCPSFPVSDVNIVRND